MASGGRFSFHGVVGGGGSDVSVGAHISLGNTSIMATTSQSGAGDSADLIGWDKTLEDGELLEFSTFHDEAEDDESADDMDPASIQDRINERYNRVTSLYLDDDGWCNRYAYYSEGTSIPSFEEHNHVIIIRGKKSILDESIKSDWLKLNKKAKNKLYVILYAAKAIWKRIHYNIFRQEWSRRNNARRNDPHSGLAAYGVPSKQGLSSMLDILADGRSAVDLKKDVKDVKCGFLCYQRLEDVWVLALLSGMRNGSGRAAVYMLLDVIAGLLSGFDEKTYPKIAITHITSSSANDAFSITSSNSSKPKTRSSSKSPALKRRRVDEKPRKLDDERRRKVDDSDEDSECEEVYSASSKGNKRPKRVTWPKRNRHFVDLRIVSHDVSSGAPKYIIVVEIHSKGKTLLEAQQKFSKELVHVLQFQSQVYGIFVNETCVWLYKAKRDANDTIIISQEDYDLLEGPRKDTYDEHDHWYFRVAQFQRLIMDIFTCLVHGLDYIDA